MLSIIVPFCNEVPQVLFTAQSLCEELRDADCEILLIDNRSDSETFEECQKAPVTQENYFIPEAPMRSFDCYSKPWRHKIRQKSFFEKSSYLGKIRLLTYDRKLSHWNAKNVGIQAAKGEYILFLDAHCVVSKGSISKMLAFLKNPPDDTVGTVHMVINYMLDSRSLEYALVPEKFCYRFCTAQKQTEPYEVACMSTCGMMCRKDLLTGDLGAWNPELGIYGGGEAYINFKYATCGYTHWIYPGAVCWHYAADRGYSWNLWDWTRNNLIAAYTVGGEEWLENLVSLFEQEGRQKNILDTIASNVISHCKTDRDNIAKNQEMTYDDYVSKWTSPSKKETPKPKVDTASSSPKMSVIVPAFNESHYLNRTIQNIFDTADDVEIIVVDQGGNGEIDPRVRIIKTNTNVGERKAMNLAAGVAEGQWLFRIDAHCDFSPKGWDTMLCEVTGERDLTMAVLTACRMPFQYASQAEKDKWYAKDPRPDWIDWDRLKGHWYGFTRLIISEDKQGRKGLEAKWQKANRDHAHYTGVHPTMSATGCGMCIRKSFYDEIGGADEKLPEMGAIGEEISLKVWSNGGKCQVHTDVMVGHIFGTGGYPTEPVKKAQQMLYDMYGDRYDEIANRPEFKTFESLKLIKTDQPGRPIREVDVIRTDTHDSKDGDGKVIRRRVAKYRYLWIETEHPDERDWTDKQIEKKYGPLGTKISEQILYIDEHGVEIPQQSLTDMGQMV